MKNFNQMITPLTPSCFGLILGIVFAFKFQKYLNLGFFLFGIVALTLFLLFFSKILFLTQKKVYWGLTFCVFLFLGGMILQINKLLVHHLTVELELVHEMFDDEIDFYDSGHNIITRVDEVSQNVEGRYPCRVTLDLSLVSPAFYKWHLMLFLRKNFLNIGDVVILRDFVLLPPNLSDLRQNCLGLIFYQPGQTKLRKFTPPYFSFGQRLNIFKRKLCDSILGKMSLLTRSFYGLIFLGYRQKEVPVNLRESFQMWGVSHYLARSGLHLTIFSYICLLLFMTLPLGILWRYFIAVIVSLIYYFLTYASVSFLRAELMFLMAIFAKIFLRRSQQLHFLVLTCMLVLLFNPYQLFALDFQLSFSLVFALLLVSQLLARDNDKKLDL